MAKGADAFILCSRGEAIAMSLIENMYIKKLILVSNTMGNKSVINDGINGYVCDKAEEYAEHIKAAMKEFPKELPERAYQDVLEMYNTDAMKKNMWNSIMALWQVNTDDKKYELFSFCHCSYIQSGKRFV